MLYVTVALLLLLLVSCTLSTENVKTKFERFMKDHHRLYFSDAEMQKRYEIFEKNMKVASQLQILNPLAVFGVNEFSDMSADEFKSRHNSTALYAKITKGGNKTTIVIKEMIYNGKKIDWRTLGAVTGVKNQGQCGSCWSFSTTGGIEGQWFLAGNKLTSLSEQELVSCDTNDSGCNGGLMDNAFEWLVQQRSGQIVTEKSYPYVSGGGSVPSCSSKLDTLPVGAVISGYHDLPHSESKMAAFVFTSGPLSIAVDASSWQSYNGGIMTNCVSQSLDHGVLIVGFDASYSTPYWIIKNSWGTSWGEEGYLRVEMGTDQCLITKYPTTSIVKKNGPTSSTTPMSTSASRSTTSPTTGSGNTIIQMNCADYLCSVLCTNNTYTSGTCYPAGGGGYVTVSCNATTVTMTMYSTSTCTGSSQVSTMATNQCLSGGQGYFENICSSSITTTSAPPTPPTTGSGRTLIQMNCGDAACSQGCYNNTFISGTCYPAGGGGYATISCNATTVTMTMYSTSTCTGSSQVSTMATNQCLSGGQGYFENICYKSSITTTSAPPTPPTTGSGNVLSRMICSDETCIWNCYHLIFIPNNCYSAGGTGYVIVSCNSTTVTTTAYMTSTCTGSSQVTTMPTNQCIVVFNQGSFENNCLTS